MYIDSNYIYLMLIIIGLCLGSFAGASVWRLRAGQLVQDKLDGEEVDDKEYKKLKKLTKKSISNDRSRCLDCGYLLKWYDLIPLFSWIFLGGRCRKCRAKIGWMEPLIETAMATFFVLSYMFWPYPLTGVLEVSRLIIWLIAGIPLAILFVYDAKWSLLDLNLNLAVILLGLLSAITVIIGLPNKPDAIVTICGAVLILSGLYYIIYKISDGKFVGGGDPSLCLGLALLIADWKLAFIALFAANLIGCIIVIPSVLSKKLSMKSPVPLGPLLIIGSIIAVLAGNFIINTFFFTIT